MARKRPRRRILYVRLEPIPDSERKWNDTDYMVLLFAVGLVVCGVVGIYHWLKDGLAGNGW